MWTRHHAASAVATAQGILWSGEPIDRLMRYCLEEPRLSNLIGRAGSNCARTGAPARREAAHPSRRPPLPWPAGVGLQRYQWQPRDPTERDAVSAQVQQFIDHIGTPSASARCSTSWRTSS